MERVSLGYVKKGSYSEIPTSNLYPAQETSGANGPTLSENQRKALGIVVAAQKEERPVVLSDIRRVFGPGNGSTAAEWLEFRQHIANINSHVGASGYEIVDIGKSPGKDSPPKNSWRLKPKIEIGKTNKEDIERKILDIDRKTYRLLKIVIGNQVLVAHLGNKWKLLTNSPEELVNVDLAEIGKIQKRNFGKLDASNPKQKGIIREFVIGCVENPIDEYEGATDEKLRSLTDVQKRIRSLKLILKNGSKDHRNEILDKVKDHFSEPTSSQGQESPKS